MLKFDMSFEEFSKYDLEEINKQIEDYIEAHIDFKSLKEAYQWWCVFNKKFYKTKTSSRLKDKRPKILSLNGKAQT